MERIIGFLGALIQWGVALFIAGYFITSPVFGFNEVTIYKRSCYGFPIKKHTECKAQESLFTKISYKASFDNQVVIKKRGMFIDALKNCQVYDRKNWKCGNVSMLNGAHSQYFDDTDEYSSEYNQRIWRVTYTYWITRQMFGL